MWEYCKLAIVTYHLIKTYEVFLLCIILCGEYVAISETGAVNFLTIYMNTSWFIIIK